jgi:AcrR family transcriptional regulator
MPSVSAPGRRYGGKTHEQRSSERRERLLDAGLELFGTRGYAHTTIEALCAAAGLNPRYFYEQFDTREELLGAVYDRHVQAVTRTVLRALEGAPPEPLERLQVGLRAFLDSVLADERGARINYFEMVGVSHGLERKRRDVLRAYADMVAQQITEISRSTPVPVRDHRLAAVALVGAGDGLIMHSLSSDRGAEREAIITTLVELVDSVLRDDTRRR